MTENNTPLIFYRLSEDIPLQHNLLPHCSFYPPSYYLVALTAHKDLKIVKNEKIFISSEFIISHFHFYSRPWQLTSRQLVEKCSLSTVDARWHVNVHFYCVFHHALLILMKYFGDCKSLGVIHRILHYK